MYILVFFISQYRLSGSSMVTSDPAAPKAVLVHLLLIFSHLFSSSFIFFPFLFHLQFSFLASPDALEVIVVTDSLTHLLTESALALTWLMWPWWVMIPIEDLTDVALAIEDTDEDEEDEEDEGWSAMAPMCKPSTFLGRCEEKRGKENQWLNFKSFLGSFPFYRLGF